MSAVPEVGVAELPADAVLLDVREDDEWQAGHAPDARHLPMSRLTERLAEIPDADPLYVICRSGARSARVVAFLNQQGHSVGERGRRHAVLGRAGAADGRRARRLPGGHLSPASSTPGAPATCPRCGRARPRPSGPFCPHCGRYLAPLRWVAEPPPSAAAAPAAAPRPPLRRPAALPVRPAVGLRPRPVAHRRPAAAGAGPAARHPLDARPAGRRCCGPPRWSRCSPRAPRCGATCCCWPAGTTRCPPGAVAASDALVAAAGWVAPVVAALAGLLLVLWTVRATEAAAEQAGVRPSRSARMIVLGWLVPGLNLSVPGSALAEIEHAALGRPAGQRPRPSRLLLGWWAAVGRRGGAGRGGAGLVAAHRGAGPGGRRGAARGAGRARRGDRRGHRGAGHPAHPAARPAPGAAAASCVSARCTARELGS